MNIVEVRDLTLSFKSRELIKAFAMDFTAGCYAIVGENGCGKTTLLETLAGVLPIHKGQIKVLGHDLALEAKQAKRSLSYMPDEAPAYPFMRGDEFINLVAGFKSAQVDDEIKEYLMALKLESASFMEFSKMSLGTQRKFTLIAAMIGNPRVLLMDEPANGLDADAQNLLVRYVNQIKASSVVIFTSHLDDFIDKVQAQRIELKDYA